MDLREGTPEIEDSRTSLVLVCLSALVQTSDSRLQIFILSAIIAIRSCQDPESVILINVK